MDTISSRSINQASIEAMMDGIAKEYDSSGVALDGERVAGTVGIELLSIGNAVLKRMMTDKEYRWTGFTKL